MAGIGFELRKIFKSDKISNRIKGFAYATMVSVGPMIISVLMIIAIGQYMRQTRVPILERDLVNTTVMYSFIFAMIVVSILSMTLSRYLADQIYLNRREYVLSSLLGSVIVLILASGFISFCFYLFSPIPAFFKFLAYLLFLELCCIYLFMIYLSAAKDYKRISLSFGIGAMLTMTLTILLRAMSIPVTLSVMIGLDCGLMVNMVLMLFVVKKQFSTAGTQIFHFIKYLTRMPLLVLSSLFYALGLFSHNFIYWLFSDVSVRIFDTFVYAPAYDNATFFAVLTIVPSSVIFVVRVETSFYEKYREFCQAIINGGSLKAIDMTKGNMIATLKKELSSLFEIQFLTTLIMIILGAYAILPAIGADSQTIGNYSILAIGYFLIQIMFITMTMLLYFDNQEDSFKTATIFFVIATLASVATLYLGQPFYGLGLCAGALAALAFSVRALYMMLSKVDYRLFSKPPYMSEAEVIGPQEPVAKADTSPKS